MMRRILFALAACLVAAVMVVIVQGWRLGSFDLMQIGLSLCG